MAKWITYCGAILFTVLAREACANDYKCETALALHALDYSQTLYISGHENEYRETNPILGDHPSKAEVSRYFGASAILLYGLCKYLPENEKKWVAYPWIAIESGAVMHNISIGVKFSF